MDLLDLFYKLMVLYSDFKIVCLIADFKQHRVELNVRWTHTCLYRSLPQMEKHFLT